MSTIIKNNTTVFVIAEATEGTYDPASLGSEAIAPLGDGFEIIPSKESLERTIMTGSIGVAAPRNGMKTGSATIPVEMRASTTEGAIPEYNLLAKGALGNSRAAVTKTSDDTEGGTYSDTVICFLAADISAYTVGDILHIKRAGAHHVSPITAIGTNEVTLLVADPAGAFVDGLVVSAVTTYYPANSGHQSMTVEAWGEGVRKEYLSGAKVTSMALNNYTTGQLADLSFGLEGAGFDQSIGTLGVTPTYSAALPPIVLNACLYVDGVQMDVNDVSLSLENTLGWITSTCSANGRISSRVATRNISGSFTPYKDGTSVANFDRFDANTSFSLFTYAYNPTGTAGEFNQIVAFYLPQVLISEYGSADKDGIVQESLSFKAHRGNAGDTDEMFFCVI